MDILEAFETRRERQIAESIMSKSDLSAFPRSEVYEVHEQLKGMIDSERAKNYEMEASIAHLEPTNWKEFETYCKLKNWNVNGSEARKKLHDITRDNLNFDFITGVKY